MTDVITHADGEHLGAVEDCAECSAVPGAIEAAATLEPEYEVVERPIPHPDDQQVLGTCAHVSPEGFRCSGDIGHGPDQPHSVTIEWQ